MTKEKKKLNQFMIVGCSQIGLLVLLIIFAIVYSVNASKTLSWEEKIENILSPKTVDPISVLLIICFTLYLGMSLGSSIAILVIKWQSEWCINNKILLGILTLFLGFITVLIFSELGKQNLKHVNQNKNHHNYYNDFPNEAELDETLEKVHNNQNVEQDNY